MEANKKPRGSGDKAVRPPVLPAAGSDATQPPLPGRAGTPAQQVDADQPAVEAVVDESSAAAQDEEEDEQVERFFALLANIRAMRGLPPCSGAASSSRKRTARHAEPPWRPAFRMEDFEEPASSSSSSKTKKQKQTSCGGGAEGDADGRGGREVAVVAPSSSLPRAPLRLDSQATNNKD